MLRIGILGLGEGRSTLSAVLHSEKWELVKMCDLNEELCKQRAKEFDFYDYTTRYEDLLNDPTIDAIGIYTPDHLHAQHIIMAFEHGKHVVCTKPLIDDLSVANELLALAEKTGRKLLVGQSSRFFEPIKKQRADYDAGLIGELITIETHYNADHRWFLGKGWSLSERFRWLFGGLSHPVDFIRWYLPEIEEVMGYGMLSPNGKAGGLKNFDTMHFIFKAKDGRIARTSGTYSSPIQPVQRDSEMTCILRGTEGASQADYMDLRYAITDKTGEERILTFEHKLKHYFRFEGKSHHAGEYQNYLDYFAICLEKDEAVHPGLKEGLGTVTLLHAMDQSLQTGLPVKIEEIRNKYSLK
ncbi:MAG: Gfo/Idh/MocA family protein [Prolixibacteraceae bacterium]